MPNFTDRNRLLNQLFDDLNEVFNHSTLLDYDDSVDFERYEDIKTFSYYFVREYIVNTYGFKKGDPITNKLCREWVRKNYGDGNMPMVGDIIEMVNMPDDPNPIPPGTKGLVVGYTSVRGPFNEDHIHVDWENSRNLSIIVGVDEVKIVKKI